MGKSYKKSNRSANTKNEGLNKAAVEDDDAIFGRVMKGLGNGRFRIQVPNEKGHGIEVDAYRVGKTVVRIQIGDVVIVGRNESSKHVTYEILGSCKKDVIETLRKANRLHPSLFTEEDVLGDDIFDRSEDVKEEEETVVKKEKANKTVRGGKITVPTDDDDDINIDAI